MSYMICKLDIRTHVYVKFMYVYIYIYTYVCISIFICTPVISFHFCLFSFLISQGKWVNNVIGPQLRAEWFANAWQHLHCDTSHASSEFPRSFESPRVCGDGGGSRPWKCVLGHGPMWGPLKYGWASGLVLIAVFEAPVFVQAGMEVHATNAFIRDLNKGTIHVQTRDQLKVIKLIASCHWFFFAVPLECWTVRGTCLPQRLGIVVDLYLAVMIVEKVTMFSIERWRCHSLMKQFDTSWTIMEEYGGWFLDGFRTPPAKCWLLARAL